MLSRVLKKMQNNKWMVFCLLIGFVVAAAMLSSIPIYTGGALQRMLSKDLESYQQTTQNYPGLYNIKMFSYGPTSGISIDKINRIDKAITGTMYDEINVPILSKSNILSNEYIYIPGYKDDEGNSHNNTFIKIKAVSDIQNYIKLNAGKMFSNEKQDNVYEAIISPEAMLNLNLVINKVYDLSNINLADGEKLPYKIKIVGVFEPNDKNDIYWNVTNFNQLGESILIDYDLFKNEYLKEEGGSIVSTEWVAAFDYHKIKANKLNGIVKSLDSQAESLKKIGINGFTVNSKINCDSILRSYNDRAKSLNLILWVLQVPIIMMLVFYLFMVSQLVINQDKNEIAVLKSRGASSGQIFNSYFIESIILSLVALILGPFAGLFMCKILGASNGFLQFIDRAALPVGLNIKAYIFSIYAALVFIITMLIPALLSARTSIVEYKQSKARSIKKPLWQKYFIDFVLFAVSFYGLYSYRLRQGVLKSTGVGGSEIPIDPLLFLISTFFILSIGLIFLRLYPYIIRVIYFIGRKIWSPAVYFSLINVGRENGMNQFIMIFLILTISLGIFNANAARTINTNAEEKVKYSIGSDIVLNVAWDNNDNGAGDEAGNAISSQAKAILYREPPFEQFQSLKGVEYATKVLYKNNAVSNINKKTETGINFMAIEPSSFGKTAWLRDGILPYHFYDYLNLMTKDSRAMLVSRSFETKYKMKVGDKIEVRWGNGNKIEGIIYAFVDYWPTYNPYAKDDKSSAPSLIVANLSYVYMNIPIEPYEVWLKKENNASSEEIYNDILEKKIPIQSLKDTSQEIIKVKNDPILQGTNGALTLGFVVTILISMIGFLIFWIISIKQRTLQFGIFRAMGISMKQIIKMLICEQILISGVSIFTGIIVGGITSDLFVPLLQMAYNTKEQVPPFKVVALRSDYIKLYIIVSIILILGFLILSRMISKIKINQALKLGED